MDKFYKRKLVKDEILLTDTGVSIKDTIKLIENSPYKNELFRLFNIDSIKNEFIKIPGARTLINGIISKDEEFQKFDIEASVGTVSCTEINEDSSLNLEFSNIENDLAFAITNSNKVIAKTIYSSKSDFFEGLYRFDKYANYCIREGNNDLVLSNLDRLKVIYKDEKSHYRSYRIIKDSEGEYFLRAITSVNNYRDYNVRFAVFIALISLHKEAKNSGHSYCVHTCEYNESNLRLYFEKSGIHLIPGVGNATFLLEIVNDEIKRDAMRFSGLYSIKPLKSDDSESFIVKPKAFKSSIVSIKHNIKPATVFAQLQNLININKVQGQLLDDLNKIKNAKNPNELRYLLYQRITDIKQETLKEFKSRITPVVEGKISTIAELLKMMKRVDDLVTDLDAKEYLRYIFYDVLTHTKDN